MDIFGTKTTKNQLLRVKLLPEIIFWIFLTLVIRWKNQDFEPLFTYWTKSKQTADKSNYTISKKALTIDALRFG